MEEHSTDNRATEDRNLYRLPDFKRRVQMDSDKSEKICGTLAQLVEQ